MTTEQENKLREKLKPLGYKLVGGYVFHYNDSWSTGEGKATPGWQVVCHVSKVGHILARERKKKINNFIEKLG